MSSIPWSSPDPYLELMNITSSNESLILTVKSTRTSSPCPVCSKQSFRSHSQYTRKVQDLPISGQSVEMLLLTRRLFCCQPDCPVKIFTERFDWLSANGRRTLRTEEVLRKMAFSTSCLTAEKVARSAHIPVSHDTLLTLIHRTDINSGACPPPDHHPIYVEICRIRESICDPVGKNTKHWYAA
jgi:transposase